ncbi:Tn3 family transposase [Streptomyces brevispora]|uniref:Tn3 family transposase n=1 Tax=Streptomyces brevispora TaxID=887462 RepID=UPI0039A6A9EA
MGTSGAWQVLRRFTLGGPEHPAYQAIGERGRAVRTVFVCDCLAGVEMRRGIHEGLQVVEKLELGGQGPLLRQGAAIWPGRTRSCRRCPCSRSACSGPPLVHVNTLLMQRQVLADRSEAGRHPHRSGPARTVSTVLDARESLRPFRAGHEHSPRPAPPRPAPPRPAPPRPAPPPTWTSTWA